MAFLTSFTRSCAISSLALFFALGQASPAMAEASYPILSGEITFELDDDWTVSHDNDDDERNELFTVIEPYIKASFTENLAIETSLVFEPVQDADAGDSTIMQNEGLFVEELKLTYTTDRFGLYAGKFNPAFGSAWDLAPGIYGADFAEDYETTERIGFGGSYTCDAEQLGKHTLNLSTFFADTSGLSDSLITSRGNTSLEDGGLSNTEDLSSYALALDSESVLGVENLNTHLGYRNQSEGDVDTTLDREKAYAVGANYTVPVGDHLEFMFLGEWVGITDSAGGTNDVDYVTASTGVTIYEQWNVAFSHTTRNTQIVDEADDDDHMTQVTGGYTFDNGLSFDAGFKFSEEDNVDKTIFGMGFVYSHAF